MGCGSTTPFVPPALAEVTAVAADLLVRMAETALPGPSRRRRWPLPRADAALGRPRALHGPLVLGRRGHPRAAARVATLQRPSGMADHRRAAGLRRRGAGVRGVQPARPRGPSSSDRRRRQRRRAGERAAADGRGSRVGSPLPFSDGFLLGLRLSDGAEAPLHLVRARTGDGAGGTGRRDDRRHCGAPPRERLGRAGLAGGHRRHLPSDARRWGARLVHRARRSLHVPPRRFRHPPSRTRAAQPRRAVGFPWLLRPHVGALRHVGVVSRLLLGRAANGGEGFGHDGRARHLRRHRHRRRGVLGRRGCWAIAGAARRRRSS